MTERKGTTDNHRTIITTTGEEPKSSRRTKRHYDLWKLAKTLELDEIEFLISKRKKELKYEKSMSEIRNLRTDIRILEDSHIINREKMKKEEKNGDNL